MSETTATVTSNMEAGRLAVQTERNRVLGILALADPPVSDKLLRAISNGTPLAATRRIAAEGGPADQSSNDDAPRKTGESSSSARGKWGDVVRRQNEQQRSRRAESSSAGKQ